MQVRTSYGAMHVLEPRDTGSAERLLGKLFAQVVESEVAEAEELQVATFNCFRGTRIGCLEDVKPGKLHIFSNEVEFPLWNN